MSQKYHCIVVGAGPCGIAAAYVMAKAGLKVVLLERGEYPGAKNMFGGVLFSRALHDLIPNFWLEAPVERPIVGHRISLLTPESSVAMDFRTSHFAEEPYNGFSVLRAKFDRWFAHKAEEAGAIVVPETLVESLSLEKKVVVGVRTGRKQGELLSDTVIIAEGANSLLANKLGMASRSKPEDVALGIKEILDLPGNIIEERLNLGPNQGVSLEFIGSVTCGHIGGGYLYTNKSSISIGVVVNLKELTEAKMRPEQLLDDFKRHPTVAPLIKDSVFKEYAAKLIPEAGYGGITRLHSDGVLVAGDAAGFTLNTGINLEGANLAIASGRAAAETVINSKHRGDFSERSLAEYTQLLHRYGVLPTLKKFRRAPKFMLNPRIYNTYPDLISSLVESAFAVGREPKQGLITLARRSMKDRLSFFNLVRDVYNGVRALK
jgi:electron transfer flavoprotein-quinone oxidoreductase